MLEDEERRKGYGEKAREMVEKRFSLQRMVNEYEGLYEYHLQRKGII